MELAKTADYEIQISGALHERWSRWFGDITITVEQHGDRPPLTVFHCPAMDQARLRGILNTIWDLNLDLVAVQRLPDDQVDESKGGYRFCESVRTAPTRTGINWEDKDV